MRKYLVAVLLLVLSSSTMEAQKFPIVTNHYNLDLSFDFSRKSLDGLCQIEIENTSDSVINGIPFLLYRLMKIEYVKDSEEKNLPFRQLITEFEDFPLLQTNSILIDVEIAPHQKKVLELKYNGYLVGYAETGMKYITDKISTQFTLIRNDAYSYPILAKPSIRFLRQNIVHNFDYTINVTVPDSLVVANGGILLKKEKIGDNITYSYKSKKPNWRIDIAIAPFKILEAERFYIFYYTNPTATQAIADCGTKAFALYENWWGNLKDKNVLTIIETETGSGGQADETAILLPQESFADKNAYEQLYHELSHLWNIKIAEKEGLSPRWEEGLATFSQYLATEKLDKDTNGYLKDRANANIKWLKKSFEKNTVLRHTPMIEFGNKQLTNYSYVQGMIMFSILYYWLGEDKFNQTIRYFYETYYSREASTVQFTDAWYKITKNKRVKDFFNDWVYTTDYTSLFQDNTNIDNIIDHYK